MPRLSKHLASLVDHRGIYLAWPDLGGPDFLLLGCSSNVVSDTVGMSSTETSSAASMLTAALSNGCTTALAGSTFRRLRTFYIKGEQHFNKGTGGLAGAKGSLRFSLIDEVQPHSFIVLSGGMQRKGLSRLPGSPDTSRRSEVGILLGQAPTPRSREDEGGSRVVPVDPRNRLELCAAGRGAVWGAVYGTHRRKSCNACCASLDLPRQGISTGCCKPSRILP